MDELALVEHIRKMANASGRGLTLGIGDDCAIFRPRGGEELLFTADQMIEDVHFHLSSGAGAIGERALARSLSDIAAMGGEPRFCLVSLTASDPKWILAFYRGLLRLARRTGTALAGGDLARGGKIYCDVMVCGSAPRGRALRRDGARPGNAIYVSGRLGRTWNRRIEPRLDFGKSLIGRATACIDLSDGLSMDLHRLCLESGVAAELENIPTARGADVERGLHGGEDYELLFTLPASFAAPCGAIRIGAIVTGVPGSIRFQDRDIQPFGYDHFRK